MLGLEYFSFRDLWTPWLLAVLMAVAILYTLVVGPWRHRIAGSEPVSVPRQLVFISAIGLLYLTQGGALNLLGHLMFTFHMTNMAISYMLVPPMILFGIPPWLWRRMFRARFWRFWLLRIWMNPVVGLLLFILLFSFYHIPDNHDFIMTHLTVHRIYYVLLLVSSMLMWWHIFCPVPEWERMKPLLVLGYVFMSGLLLTPACVMIIFAPEPLFGVYNDPQVWVKAMAYCVAGDPSYLLSQFNGPAFFNLLTPKDDQQLGGIVMKLLQEFVNSFALYVVFMKWYRRERVVDDDPEPAMPAGGRLNNV